VYRARHHAGAYGNHHEGYTQEEIDAHLAAGDLLTTEQTRRLLDISETTLRRRIMRQVITPVPRRATVRWAPNLYRREDVERLRNGG